MRLKNMLIMSFLSFALSALFLNDICAKQLQSNEMQSIQGASTFSSFSKKNVYIVRISVDPGILSKNETTTEKIMRKLTVVACAQGNCHFCKIMPGLGLFTTQFKLTIPSNNHFKLLVVACSHLGCVKKKLIVKVSKPKYSHK